MVVLSLLFLGSRLLHLLFCVFPLLFPDETLTGTIAKELIEGLKIPFFDYVGAHYSSGNLIYGLLTAPFFTLFGKSLFSLRLAGVLFQYGAFITWYCFMQRFFGNRPALYTALLYLFCPPWMMLYTMYGFGAHSESLLFTAVGLYLLYRILYVKNNTARDAVFLGLVTGFGIYFSYQIFLSLLSYLLLWYYEKRNLFVQKAFYLFCLSFLAGFSPWILYNFLHHFQGLELMKDSFIYPYWERVLTIPIRFLKFTTLKTIGMFSFNYRKENSFQPHFNLFNGVYYALLLFSYLILYRLRERKTYILFLFPLLYLVIASISRLYVSPFLNRYFIPLFPFFFATLGLGLHHLGTFSRNLKKLSIGLLLLLMAMGLIGELNLLSPKDAFLALKYQGYSYRELGWAVSYRYLENFEKIATLGKKVANRLSTSEKLAFYHGLSNCEFHLKTPEDVQKYLPWIENLEGDYQPFFLKEAGRVLGLSEGNFSERIDSITKLLGKEDQPYLIEGLVTSLYPPFSHMKPDPMLRYALGHLKELSLKNRGALAYALGKLSWGSSYEASFLEKIKQRRELESQFQKTLLSFYYRGVGALLAESYDPLFRTWPFSLEQGVEGLNPRYQEFIFWGAGFETPLHFEDPYEYERMKASVPLKFQHSFEQGLKDRFAWGGHNRWFERTSK